MATVKFCNVLTGKIATRHNCQLAKLPRGKYVTLHIFQHPNLSGKKVNWQNDQLAKFSAGKMVNWQNGQLAKWSTGKMIKWQNGQLANCQLANCQQTKWSTGKLSITKVVN